MTEGHKTATAQDDQLSLGMLGFGILFLLGAIGQALLLLHWGN